MIRKPQLHHLSAEESAELLNPFPDELTITSFSTESLPYEELDGLRFERLCYEILCSEGKNPRYNGKSGQPDYGVDIVTEHQNMMTVYQCKNINDKKGSGKTIQDIQNAYERMLHHWVGEQGLPKPNQFIYYSRRKLDDITTQKEYTLWRTDAFQKDEIDIQLWGRETLDSKLRHQPSIVSGIFSDQIANLFCNENSLPQDANWERLQSSRLDYPTLFDFYDDWKNSKLFIKPDLKQWFMTAISSSPVMLLQGPPGTGKTTTTLSLLATMNKRFERIYYTVISNFEKLVDLRESVKKRAQLPSVFILDDCHSAPKLVIDFIQNLKHSLLRPKHSVPIKFVLLIRGTPEEKSGIYVDSIKSMLELDATNAIDIPLSNSDQILQILKKRLPTIHLLTKDHAKHVFKLTGGNLKLVKVAIEEVQSPENLFEVDISSLRDNVFRQYIYGIDVKEQQFMKNLCALAMFDITPLTSYLDFAENFLKKGLVTRLYSPARIRFAHSSLAEVVFLVLTEMKTGKPDNWNEPILQELIRYMEYLKMHQPSQLDPFLLNLSNAQLSVSDFNLKQIMSGFLKSPEFSSLLTPEPIAVSLHVLRRLLATVSPKRSTTARNINNAICRQLQYLVNKPEVWNQEDVRDFINGIYGLRQSSPEHLGLLENQLSVGQLITRIKQTGSLVALFRLLEHSSPFRAFELIEALESNDLDVLIQKTIEQQRSVGTLHLALRDLSQKTLEIDGKQKNLLAELEQLVTVRHLLDLIAHNGTIFELFSFLQYSSPSRASKLIEELKSKDIDTLVHETIEQQRSVATLNLTLRDLGQKTLEVDGKRRNLLTELEQTVTAQHLLDLIIHNGTIFELFRLLEHSSLSRASELIEGLKSNDLDTLIQKIIEQQRSIESLHYKFKRLNRHPNSIEKLLKVLSPTMFARLIIRAGTLNSLMSLSHLLPDKYQSELRATISLISPEEWQKLIFRGWPSSLCGFLSQQIEHYPDSVHSQLNQIMTNEGRQFLEKSSWYELNDANYDSEETITSLLRKELERLLTTTPIEACLGLGYKESTSAFSVIWRYAPSQHDVLNAQFWDLLPSQNQWPKDYQFGLCSSVLQHLCHPNFSRQNAEKFLQEVSTHALQVNWEKANLSPLVYFFWQFWQASNHWSVSKSSPYFSESLFDTAINLLKKRLQKTKYQNSDKIQLYALAGLLWYIWPDKEWELREIIQGKLTGLNYLCQEIHKSPGNECPDFLNAHFSLYGMGLVRPLSQNFTDPLKETLKAKYLEFPYKTPAVEALFKKIDKNS